MKEKIKNSFFIISIAYSILVIVLMLYSYHTSINVIPFRDDEENLQALNDYKERLQNVNESSCKKALDNLINHYEKTSYDGDVNLQELYFSEDYYLEYAADIFNNCNLNKEERESIAIKMITASIQLDEIFQRLSFQYELRIPDLTNRDIMAIDTNTIEYNINRKNQLEIIKIVTDILEGENTHE